MHATVQKKSGKYIISVEIEDNAVDWKLDPEDRLEVTAADGVVSVRPFDASGSDAKFNAAKKDIFSRYEQTFKDLAK